MGRKLPYHGAGILFAARGSPGWEVLLFQRAINPYRGHWSVVGGRCHRDEPYRDAAAREASEEALAGQPLEAALAEYLPRGFSMQAVPEECTVTIPFLFTWRNYLVCFDSKPPLDMFRLNWENRALAWFSTGNLPEAVYPGLPATIRVFDLG